jgi:hypothetical protein
VPRKRLGAQTAQNSIARARGKADGALSVIDNDSYENNLTQLSRVPFDGDLGTEGA